MTGSDLYNRYLALLKASGVAHDIAVGAAGKCSDIAIQYGKEFCEGVMRDAGKHE